MTPDEVADLRRWLDASGGIAEGRPFLGDPRLDALVEVVLEMAAQLWMIRRRNAVLEEVLVQHRIMTDGTVEGHQLSERLTAALKSERTEFVATIFRSFAELPMEQASIANDEEST